MIKNLETISADAISVKGVKEQDFTLLGEAYENRIREIVREELYQYEQRIRQLETQLAQLAAEVSFLIAEDKKSQPLIQ
jgi:phage baseplate assembly protein W